MIPFGTDCPQRRTPWMNYFLIAANVVCYIVSHSVGGHGRVQYGGLSPAWAPYLLTPTHLRLYQFFTYQFLHENLGHIFFNMLFLYVFGNNLNEKLGHLGYLLVYLTGGVLAGCGQVMTSSAPTLGASGAISAVAGLFMVLLPRTSIRIFVWIFVYVDVWEIPSVYFIIFSVLKDFFEPLLFGGDQTAHAAHLTGNFAGFAIGLLLLLTNLVQRDHYDLLALIGRWRRRKQYESLVAGGYDPFRPTSRVKRSKDEPESPALNPAVVNLREQIARLIREQQLPAAVNKYMELRAIAPNQVLASQDQLDIANQLMTDKQYGQAASAYEDFLRVYPGSHQQDHVMLVLAVIYTRYLARPQRAIELFRGALARLHDPHQKKWVEDELAQLAPPSAGAAPSA